ncbi:hypothetical protein XENTR_v10006672 [Xenopus tropicalis]|nr:hypothetical protein XENTR_v10006672 [Xenopus tropicalis]
MLPHYVCKNMGSTGKAYCPKCREHKAKFLHRVWAYPKIIRFWNKVIKFIHDKTTLPRNLTPQILLLGIVDKLAPHNIE